MAWLAVLLWRLTDDKKRRLEENETKWRSTSRVLLLLLIVRFCSIEPAKLQRAHKEPRRPIATAKRRALTQALAAVQAQRLLKRFANAATVAASEREGRLRVRTWYEEEMIG